jgi:hypothetical protein
MKFCLAISYDFIFFGPLIGVLGGVKVEKVYTLGDFDTKYGLKLSFLSFMYRETVQNNEN